MTIMRKYRAFLAFPVIWASLWATALQAQDITIYPTEIARNCNGGRAVLYDECGKQVTLFKQALRQANADGKTLLVSYGAEWCIWCHVFEQYIKGEHTDMTYRFGDPGDRDYEQVTLDERPDEDPAAAASALTAFVAEHFVLVHIDDQHAPDGYEVLIQTGAEASFNGGLPYIFTVTPKGDYAAHLNSNSVETRRDGLFDWYRGYDRAGLTAELDRMRLAATR